MKIKLGRHLKESIKNLARNGWMTFASISAVTITLLILGISLVIAMNAQQMSSSVQGQLSISVFMKQSVTDQQAAQVADQVRTMPGVRSVQLVTKAQGMASLQKDMKQYSSVLKGLKADDTLPDKLVVKATDPRNTIALGQKLAKLPGVAEVNDGQQVVNKLFRFLDIVRNIGLVFVAALILTAMFLISNTIKISIFARRREIEIMKLVGATNWFIRWPFVFESLIIGVIGALIPYAVIVIGYHSLYMHTGGEFAVLVFQLVKTVDLAAKLAGVLFGIGIIIGIWGGIMSVRKFLKV
ncbi:permease-like cell division protein FtsX [Alicyclobacillus cycloheptanicus]|uniref:Cell division protein FtsX n=1 Tax=Alicyclobacillus cycloheptanicus TaxID=1457 RepID=A0ABT9XM30_9BACL|nr:permease-like cell division protein FtsX [Alicyclobacillus cycloheptanicus]MDQ0191353.1 cell division transport system permease protein [Alicyclobacillus cycloheptanicus]